jgi:DNA-binding transcriptional regulator YiaG
MTLSPYMYGKTPSLNYDNPPGVNFVVVGAMFFAFAVGTGSYPTAECYFSRSTKGHSEKRALSGNTVNLVATSTEGNSAPNQAEELKLIRDYFKPSVTQLALALGVERQTIYNWQAGKSISDERRGVIRELASACSKLAEAGILAGEDIFRRKILNGQSLIQLIASGTKTDKAVALIKSILATEKHERLVLAEHLKRRSSGMIDLTDAGAPHLQEEG